MNTKGLNDFVEQNWKLLAGVILAAVIALVAAGILNERSKANERAATNALFDAQKSVRELAEKKQITEADQALQKVAAEHHGTRAAFEASLQGGDLFMDSAKYDEAAKRYETAAKDGKDSFSKILARYNLGIALESAGKFQEAVASYKDAIALKGSDFLKPEILMAQARCFEALKEIPKAVEIYNQVQKDFASSSYYSGAAAAFAGLIAEKK
jgi:predicted negative regulator of RcsB-dependent stress response